MERIQRGSCGEKRLHRAKKKRNHSRYLFHFGGTAKENPMRRSARRRRNWQSPVVPQDATPTRRDANRNPRPGTAPANGHGPSPTTERHETQKEKRKKTNKKRTDRPGGDAVNSMAPRRPHRSASPNWRRPKTRARSSEKPKTQKKKQSSNRWPRSVSSRKKKRRSLIDVRLAFHFCLFFWPQPIVCFFSISRIL